MKIDILFKHPRLAVIVQPDMGLQLQLQLQHPNKNVDNNSNIDTDYTQSTVLVVGRHGLLDILNQIDPLLDSLEEHTQPRPSCPRGEKATANLSDMPDHAPGQGSQQATPMGHAQLNGIEMLSCWF